MVDNDTASGEQVIFFDYTALLSDPGLLDLSHPKFSLWITQAVVKGLEEDTHPIVKSVRGKLDDAINARKINCNPVDFTKNSPLPDMFGIYADLLKHASLVKKNGQRATVVTVDPTMRQGAEALGLNVVDPNGLRSMIAAAVQAETEAREEAERERRRARKQVFTNFIMGVALAAAGTVVWAFRAPIIELITAYGVLAAVAITGILLYALRGRYRLVYGVAETTVGYLTATRIIFPNVDVHSIGLVEGFALLGGLYIIVRGLDNVAKGLEKTPYEGLWRRYSGEVKA